MLLFALPVGAQEPSRPLSLDEVLDAARSANAQLQVPRYDIAIADQKRREAMALNEWKLLFQGDLVLAPPPPMGYDSALTDLGEERAQVVASRPILDGGARKAQIAAANADLSSARAGYRIAERDLDLEIRNQFIHAQSALREIEARQEGIRQLRDYRLLLESRKTAGMPVQPELRRIDLRIQGEQASILQAEAQRRQALQNLNHLMGREPSSPLDLAPLPSLHPPDRISGISMPVAAVPDASVSPKPPVTQPSRGNPIDVADPPTAASVVPSPVKSSARPSAAVIPSLTVEAGSPAGAVEGVTTSSATQGLPETSSALAGLQSAEANLAQTQAERAFTLGFSANAGLLGSNTTELVPFDLGPDADVFDRFRRDLGYSITFDFLLPMRDKTWAPRLAEARLSVEQARQNLAVAERNATLQQDLARTSLHDVDNEIALLRSTVANSRDVWLESKSLYLGGAVPFVDLTDAWTSWIDAQLQLADAERRYREAEALLIRWTSSR